MSAIDPARTSAALWGAGPADESIWRGAAGTGEDRSAAPAADADVAGPGLAGRAATKASAPVGAATASRRSAAGAGEGSGEERRPVETGAGPERTGGPDGTANVPCPDGGPDGAGARTAPVSDPAAGTKQPAPVGARSAAAAPAADRSPEPVTVPAGQGGHRPMGERDPGPRRSGGPAPAAAPGPGVRRRGPADPVRQVMQGHRDMIAGAVDVWEIAAGLEARGVTDADARRLRHRDVFGLAEEVYARVPRAVRVAGAASPQQERPWPGTATGALHLVPGAVCVLAAAVHLAALGALLAVLAGWAILRRTARGTGSVWTGGLLAFALLGPQAGDALAGDGAFDAGRGAAGFAALLLSLAPAACAAHWFAVRARAQLHPSHGLSEFADAVRPRLAAALAGYGLALLLLLVAASAIGGRGPVAGPAALGMLLFTARLLAVHGHPGPAAAGLAAACAAEALSLGAALFGPHLAGAGAEALICGAAALALAVQAFRVLPRASAHSGPARL